MAIQKRETLTFLKHQKIRDAYYVKQHTPRLPVDSSNKRIREEVAKEFDCTPGHVYRCLCEGLHCKRK